MRSLAKQKTLYMVHLAMLSALIVVLQFVGSFLTGFTGLPMSLVLIPIVVGSFHLGPTAGAFLGGVFGLMTVIMGFSGIDAFTNILFNNFGTLKMIICVALCFVKAICAGLGSGLIYQGLNKVFRNKNITLTTIIASVSAPIINTGLFVIAMLLFFFNDMATIQTLLGFSTASSSFKFIFLVLAGWNFVSEFLINLIISPAVARVIGVLKKN